MLPLWAASYYPLRLDDAKAVYLTPENFSVHGDGVADDTAAIQTAIDRAAEHGEGILFVPSGTIPHLAHHLRLARSAGHRLRRDAAGVCAWATIRRATSRIWDTCFCLPAEGRGRSTIGREWTLPPGAPAQPIEGTVPPNASVADANPGTFYSAMSNVDFEIGKGNPAAVAIRFHVAQHSYLAHMDFQIGSGLAALKDIGNEAEDLHFHGGQYGIITVRPSPGWQFTLIDSSFDGQSQAAIKEHEAGLTLIHDSFRNVPQAISVDPGLFRGVVGGALAVRRDQRAGGRVRDGKQRAHRDQPGRYRVQPCEGVCADARERAQHSTGLAKAM